MRNAEDTGKRLEIVRQAYAVFYKHGFHASGVDSLLKGSGISKRTLYKYFDSKEDLIGATLTFYQQEARQSILTFIEKSKVTDPAARALLLFDWLKELMSTGHKTGCFAMNAKLEYASRDRAIAESCAAYFEQLKDLFAELAADAGCKDAKKLGAQIMLLFQGAIVASYGSTKPDFVRAAKTASAALIASKR